MVHIKLQALLVCSFTGRKQILETKSQKVSDTNKEAGLQVNTEKLWAYMSTYAHQTAE
jgi:hypothetical protein